MELVRDASKASERAQIVTEALINSAEYLELSAKHIADVVGLSESTISRMKNGGYTLSSGSKSYELSILFVRLFRSLDAIVGGDPVVARHWMNNFNTVLNAVPADLILKVDGLTNVLNYLDSRRAKV